MSHSVHSTSSYLDHLFVATSATCVTGLVTHVTASEYTLFGQISHYFIDSNRGVRIFNADVDVLCSFKKKTNLR